MTTVCNYLFLPMHLFPFISLISRLLLWLWQTKEGYKDDNAQEPRLTANSTSPSPDYLSSLQVLCQLHWHYADLHQLKSSYTHTVSL